MSTYAKYQPEITIHQIYVSVSVAVGVRESFKKKLVRIRLKWDGHVDRMGDEKLTKREQMPRKCGGKEGEEDRECDGRTGLSEIWKEWEKNGEQRQKM